PSVLITPAQSTTIETEEIPAELNKPLSLRRNRQLSIDNLNSSRPRINSFPVPVLPREEHDDDEFFDAESHIESLTTSTTYRSLRNTTASLEDIRLNEKSTEYDAYRSSLDEDTIQLASASDKCSIDLLILIFYGGNIYSTEDTFESAKKTDFLSFRSTFDNVVRNHYPHIEEKVAIRFVSCEAICTEAISVLSSLSPYGVSTTKDMVYNENLPLHAIPLFATSNPYYHSKLSNTVGTANKVYNEFVTSKEGKNFCGQIVVIGDSNGAILAYDAMCLNRNLDDNTSLYGDDSSTPRTPGTQKKLSNPADGDTVSIYSSTKYSSPTKNENSDSISRSGDNSRYALTLAFDVNEFFSFGSPLSLILAYRCLLTSSLVKPYCGQLYNLFHACDPNAARIEPLILAEFAEIQPCFIPRYSQYPMGDGESTLLVEYVHRHSNLFLKNQKNNSNTVMPTFTRLVNTTRGSNEADINADTVFSNIRREWWGSRRIDYILYCPESLMSQPAHILPIVFHSSYWESRDVIAFILRNIIRTERNVPFGCDSATHRSFAPDQATEKWLHRTTAVKIRNLAPNHRANDTMVVDHKPQIISAKFHYGPIDMVCLGNEKVDIYVMRSAPYGEWLLLNTSETDTHGRIRYRIPDDKKLPLGMHPVKLVVRGDHTSIDLYLTVLPPNSEAVVFSIDGSFTASFSVSASDPKVRPGAVDVVRHWQELGYIIIYITARPDIQQHKVVHWLAQHNFPHGMTLFNDGLSREPIKNKAEMLRSVVESSELTVVAAYGSSKDVYVYQSCRVPPDRTFVIGKFKSRLQNQARFLVDGYALHLAELTKPGVCRPSRSNARYIVRKACFNLPKLSSLTNHESTPPLVSPSSHSSSLPLHLASNSPSLPSPDAPISSRKTMLNDNTDYKKSPLQNIRPMSNSKEAPCRGVSPRLRTTPKMYDPKLFRRAHLAKHQAYCPYSNFRVGAALLASDGTTIYSGCNIENCAYPLATCAERTAVCKAVSEGVRSFRAIAVTSDVERGFTRPCGSCRQVLAEFGPNIEIYLVNPKNEAKKYSLNDLLPMAFQPSDLEKERTISSSTDNYVSDIAAKPDVTLLCDYCKCFLKANELPSHNAYHAALQLFKFKETPTNMDILV
ncbi:unnamed protein product, partial [Didymodactylos carnosus]